MRSRPINAIAISLGIIAIGILAAVIVGLFSYRTVVVPSSGLKFITVQQPPLWKRIRGSVSTLTWRPAGGHVEEVQFADTLIKAPILVLQSRRSESILCLYDVDSGLSLLRIPTDAVSQPSGRETNLQGIVTSTTRKLATGETSDWCELHAFIKMTPKEDFERHCLPAIDFGIYRVYPKAELLLPRVQAEIDLSAARD